MFRVLLFILFIAVIVLAATMLEVRVKPFDFEQAVGEAIDSGESVYLFIARSDNPLLLTFMLLGAFLIGYRVFGYMLGSR